MGTTNITDWGVSYIDSSGTYHGDINGQALGLGGVYSLSGEVDLNNSMVEVNAALGPVALTLPDGTGGQRVSIVCISAANPCTIGFSGLGLAFNLVTFNAAGDGAIIEYFDSGAGTPHWLCTSLVGTAAIS